jgi:uncharacterized protein YraI
MTTRTGLLFLGLILSLAWPATPLQAQSIVGPMRVTLDSLNIRAAPNPNASVLVVAKKDQVYPAIRWSGSWLEIQIGARRAYAYGLYLAPTTTPVFQVKADVLNIRSGPGSQYRVLASFTRGAYVAVRGSSGPWRNFNFEGASAWVHGDYLQGVGSAPSNTSPPSTARPSSRAGFIQLAASGTGFYAYGAAYKRWGTPRLIYGVERAARRWSQESRTRMGVGNISLENGGTMAPHTSHKQGLDVDVIPMRTDSVEDGVTIFQSLYSRSRTQRIIDLVSSEIRPRVILFNDSQTRGTQSWPGHDNHFHFSAQ